MDNLVDKLFKQSKLFYCIECGKCTTICPMQKIFDNFSYEISPRGIIKRVSLGLNVLKSKEIWFCQNCTACTEACPAGVKYAEFIDSLRLLAINEGIIRNCSFCERCGQYYLSTLTLDNIKGILEERKLSSGYLNLCPKCRRYDYLEKKARIR